MPLSFEQYEALLYQIRNDLLRFREDVTKKLEELKYQDRLSFSIEEVERATGLGYDAIYKRIKTGKTKALQPEGRGGKIIIPKEEVLKLLSDEYAIKPNTGGRYDG